MKIDRAIKVESAARRLHLAGEGICPVTDLTIDEAELLISLSLGQIESALDQVSAHNKAKNRKAMEAGGKSITISCGLDANCANRAREIAQSFIDWENNK